MSLIRQCTKFLSRKIILCLRKAIRINNSTKSVIVLLFNTSTSNNKMSKVDVYHLHHNQINYVEI